MAKVDYKKPLEQAFQDEPRVFFESDTVISAMTDAFSDQPYDIYKAAAAYDELVKQNSGYMSVEDLFYVCLFGHEDFEEHGPDWQKNMWAECKEHWIEPLIDKTEDTLFINDEIVEVYDGTKFNESCTDSEYADDRSILNMVCTTGKYAESDPAFDKAMITKFRIEGGCADVGDGNNVTCYGLASKYYPQVLRKDPPFSRAEAEEIAHEKYYKKHKIDKLPDAIRGDVFMALWGTGQPKKSIGLLQKVLGVPQTNKVDEETIAAARDWHGTNLRRKFLKARWQSMKNNGTFSNGWAKAFLKYMRNGCHTVPKKPLYRTPQTVAECAKHL